LSFVWKTKTPTIAINQHHLETTEQGGGR
jgi:hypothetical protein